MRLLGTNGVLTMRKSPQNKSQTPWGAPGIVFLPKVVTLPTKPKKNDFWAVTGGFYIPKIGIKASFIYN